MKEIWKDIKEYKGIYQISNLGKVRSLDRYNYSNTNNQYIEYQSKRLLKGTILKPYDNGNGYKQVSLLKNQKRKVYYIHRLVAEYFLSNPNNLPEINHIDGNKQNNCVDNLEWCTRVENLNHAIKTGLKKTSDKQKEVARKNILSMSPEIKKYALEKAREELKKRPRNLVMKQINKLAIINSKSVLQYDLNNHLIKTYSSLNNASKETGIKSQNISMCCRNIIKQSGGYIWKYNL